MHDAEYTALLHITAADKINALTYVIRLRLFCPRLVVLFVLFVLLVMLMVGALTYCVGVSMALQWQEHIDTAMRACNARTTSNAQRVAKWALLPQDFSVEGETVLHC